MSESTTQTAEDLLDRAEQAIRGELDAFDEAVEAMVERAEHLADIAGRLKGTRDEGQKRATAARQFRESVRGLGPVRPPSPGEVRDDEHVERVLAARKGA